MGYYYLQLIRYEMEGGGEEGGKGVSTAQIEKDLIRTFPNHPLYTTHEGISSLRRVLTAFAVHNPTIGYCQSMNFICGLLLLFLDEEDAFWVLVHIVETLLPLNYTSDLLGVQVEARLVMSLLEDKFPRLMHHIVALDCKEPLRDTITKWILQLFVNILPTETVLRVFDVFLIEGTKAIVRFTLAIFKIHEQGFLSCRTMEDFYEFINRLPSLVYDARQLINVATTGKVIASIGKLDDLRVKMTKKFRKEAFDNIKDFSLRRNSLLSELEFEKVFKRIEVATGGEAVMEKEQWSKFVAKLWGGWVGAELEKRLFMGLEKNGDGSVGLEEVMELVSCLLRGNEEQKLKSLCLAFSSVPRTPTETEEEGKRVKGGLTPFQIQIMLISFFQCLEKDFSPQSVGEEKGEVVEYGKIRDGLSKKEKEAVNDILAKFGKMK